MKPVTNDEWTIHSLNIHGIFFERWCRKIIEKAGHWKLIAANEPVEFPPSTGSTRGNESNLDLHALHGNPEYQTVVLIECKKNNPLLSDWVFFPKPDLKQPPWHLTVVEVTVASGTPTDSPFQRRSVELPVADDARETKSDYRKPNTKTSNAAISEAAYQVTLAHRAIVYHDFRAAHDQRRAILDPLEWKTRAYFPMIVTSARLRLCMFDPSDVSAGSGEIPYEKAKLEDQNIIIYEYAVPPHLAGFITPPNRKTDVIDYTRLQIAVVHSEYFPKLLQTFGAVLDPR